MKSYLIIKPTPSVKCTYMKILTEHLYTILFYAKVLSCTKFITSLLIIYLIILTQFFEILKNNSYLMFYRVFGIFLYLKIIEVLKKSF